MIADDPIDEVRRLGALLPRVDRDTRERIWQTATVGRTPVARPHGRRSLLLAAAAVLALALAGAAVAGGWLGNEPAPKVDRLPIGTTRYTHEFLNGMARATQGRDRIATMQSHIAMRNLGVRHETLEVARRPSDGALCVSLHGGGSCTQLDNPGHIAWGLFSLRYGSHLEAFGAVDDDVRGVEIRTDGATYRAQVANAGFYFEFPLGVRAKQLRAFVTIFRDGSRVVTPVPRPRR